MNRPVRLLVAWLASRLLGLAKFSLKIHCSYRNTATKHTRKNTYLLHRWIELEQTSTAGQRGALHTERVSHLFYWARAMLRITYFGLCAYLDNYVHLEIYL